MKYLALMAVASSLALAGCEVGSGHTLSAGEMQTAELAASKFANNLQADYTGCSGLDSDADGYTSCEARDRSTKQKVGLQCSYQGATGGCKEK